MVRPVRVLLAAVLGVATAIASTTAAAAAAPVTDDDRPAATGTAGGGVSGVDVVDGTLVEKGEFPWMVEIGSCGGALVRPNVVLTAAYCVAGVGALERQRGLSLGMVDRQDPDRIQVTATYGMQAPGFVSGRMERNWGLYRLEQKVDLPVLPITTTPAYDEGGFTVAGWGFTSEDPEEPLSRYLRKAEVQFVDDQTCRESDHSYRSLVPALEMCAALPQGGAASCHGDTGGPLFRRDDGGQWIGVGVVSWYNRCDGSGPPGVYTQLSAFPEIATEADRLAAAPPVRPTDDSYVVSRDGVLEVGELGVLTNDELYTRTVTVALADGPDHGSLTLNPDGTFRYVPAPGYRGLDQFTYLARAEGGTYGPATARIEVNDPPVAVRDNVAAAEDTSVTWPAPGVLDNDRDADGDALTARLVQGPAHGNLTLHSDGAFEYSPYPDFNGTDEFVYEAFDGLQASEPVSVVIGVIPRNDAPRANDDTFGTPEEQTLVAGVLFNDSDVDGDALRAELVTHPAHGAIDFDADGNFSYSPDRDFAGTDSFRYRVTDGQESAEAVARIIVRGTPDPPRAAPDELTTAEDQRLVLTAPGVLDNDDDPDGDALTAELLTGPSHGSLTLAADGSVDYRPDADFAGTDSFTYRVADGVFSSPPATVTIKVTAVNDAPVGVPESYSLAEDARLDVVAPGLLANDRDVDGNQLRAELVGQAAHGTVVVGPDGSFSYQPAADFNGADRFTYRVGDGTTWSEPVAVSITVLPVNDAPTADGEAYSTPEGITLVVPAPGVLEGDADRDGDALRAVLVSGPASGSLTLSPDGSFRYVPPTDLVGTVSFIYRASDGTLSSAPATVTITMTERMPSGCTITGTPGNDTLIGTNGRDVICGLGGNDVILGGNGSDVLHGGSGNDRVDGGNDNDVITTGSGDDTVDAGNGDDTVTAGSGNDVVAAGNGNDTVDAGDGDDRVAGDNGDDRLVGGPGRDQLQGHNGNDRLEAADGAPGDSVTGDNGTDTCTRDTGDTVTGCP